MNRSSENNTNAPDPSEDRLRRPDWGDCEWFCIHNYAGTGRSPCGWRGRPHEVDLQERDRDPLCPRCGRATLMRIRRQRTQSHVVHRPDVSLRYEVSGDGPPIVFIQGIGVTGEGWRLQVSHFEGRFSTLVFDNRGIGASRPCRGPITIEAMAGDAVAVLDAAGFNSAHVVGHSMGGVIAQELALSHPEKVRSLSLLCTFARGRDAARLSPGMVWKTIRTRIGTRSTRRRAFLEMLASPGELEGVEDAILAKRVAGLIGRELADQPRIIMRQLRALVRHDVSALLGRLGDIPTKVISAGYDRIARPEYGRKLAAAIPGASFEEIAETSHGMTILRAADVNRRLERFIRSVEGR